MNNVQKGMAFKCLWVLLVLSILFSSCGKKLPGKRVLIFSKTEGYRHESIPVAREALVKLCLENGIKADTTESADYFTTDSLKNYSTVIFLMTTQNVLNFRQQAHFERYIQAGGGFVGVHSATDTEYQWPWYVKLVGASFQSHPEQQNATVDVIDRSHISTEHLPEKWDRFDEWYNFKNFNKNVHVLATLDETSYKGGENGDFHPIAWYHEFDGGRAFYTAPGHTNASYSEPEFLQHLLGGINYAIGNNTLDYHQSHTQLPPEETNFVKDVLIQRLDEPTELEVFKNGKILFGQRKGELILYDQNTKTYRTIAKINVNSSFEDGLIGLAKDPHYEKNHWIYLYYSPAGDEWVNVLSRFVFIADSLLMETEKVLLKVPVQRATCCHTGGSVEFGLDGSLYLSTGDDTNPFNIRELKYNSNGYGPMNDLPDRQYWDARRSSANTNDLRGKVLRIKPEDDGTYSIPEGNLFPKDGSKGRPEIYVMGCRNPYRISIDQKTGILYFGDVGPDANEDSEMGPKGHDEVNQVKKPGFFGWPMFIADNKPYADLDYFTGEIGSLYDPANPINNSPHNNGAQQLPPAQPAMIYYPYGESNVFEDVGTGGRNAMAGPVYHYDMYPNTRYKLSNYYDGKFFFYDWIRDWIMAATFDEDNNLLYYEPFLESFDFSNIMDMTIGPDGVLYILEYGSNWFSVNQDATLSRILYSDGNKIPTAVAMADHTVGSAPLNVHFSGASSFDYDAKDKLRFEWVLDDEIQSDEMEFDLSFENPGTYHVKLLVYDQHDDYSEDEIEILVGNDYPEVDIKFNGNKTFFWDGREINYQVVVKDKEDGEFPGAISPYSIAFTIDYIGGFDKTIEEAGHKSKTDLLDGSQLIQDKNCFACHQINVESNGPKYMDVAKRYKPTSANISMLASKVINGGSGNWGERMMAANPSVTNEEAEAMVKYILSLNAAKPSQSLDGKYVFDKHTVASSGQYQFKATYKDKGGNGIEPLQSTKSLLLKPLRIQAESFDDLSGGRPVDLVNKEGSGMSRLVDGSFLTYRNIDLTGITSVGVNYETEVPVSIEFREGSAEGKLVASGLMEPGTGDTYETLDLTIENQSNKVVDLVVVFKSDQRFGSSLFVDWYEFGLGE